MKAIRHLSVSLTRIRRTLIPWVVPLVLVFVWQLLGQTGAIPRRILPTPSAILEAAFSLAASGEIWHHLASSAGRASIGFVIGASLGLCFGVLNGILPRAEILLDSSFQMLRTIPPLAMVPLVIMWFGIGEQARIFLVSVGVFFPVYLNTLHGIRNIDPGLLEMGRVYGLRRREVIAHIVVPGAMPSILIGIRFSLGIAWILLIVGEQIAADSGIGYMALNAREFMQTDVVVLSIILYALLGKASDSLSRVLEARLLPWHPNYRTSVSSLNRQSSAI